jgi:CubicO group peptidase (beta-lactamase class C family)
MKSNRSTVMAIFLLFVSLIVVFSPAQAEHKSVSISAIEKNIENAMKTFNVPGIAVAIVKDGKVVMAKGFGVRKMGEKDKVNADTLFGIASNTKAFTVAALGMLADEGKLTWEDKVTDYLPAFQLHDPYVTREFTIRDMLSHRSGLGKGAGDLMIWPKSTITNQEIIERIRYLKPVSSFRTEYGYDNLMYIMAGEIVAKVSGMSWQDFVRSRILKPLKMNTTRMGHSLISPSNSNVATAHAPVNDVIQPVGGDFIERFESAGSMASSVNDVSKWIKVQLKGGLIETRDGKENRLFSETQHDHMWQPNTLQNVSGFDQTNHRTHFKAYGLGWGMRDHQGHKMVSHTGGIMGMVSQVVMVPEANLGVVILTNQQSGSAFYAISRDIVNRYIDVPNKDWVAVYHERLQKRVSGANTEVADLMKSRAAKSKPSLPLTAYAQTYKDDWYGDITIKVVDHGPTVQGRKNSGKKLEMHFSRTETLTGALEHFQYNTFIVRWNDRSTNADAFVNFDLTAEGEVKQATMKAVSSLTDFSFDFQDLLLKPKY